MTQTTLQNISVYPVKSLRGFDLNAAYVDNRGLAFDRRFILSDPDGNMLSARQVPDLLRYQAVLQEDGIIIVAPDGDSLSLHYPELFQNYRQVDVWGTEINAQHCGLQFDEWFTDKLGRECQLLYFGDQSERVTALRPDKEVAFSDGYPLLVISQASLDDLNRRSQVPISMRQFRTNLVVNGCAPFAEDSWKRIRIGEVEFEVVKPCSRCVMTTYDPDSAESLALGEPVKTLSQFRRGQDGEIYFGQNLVALNKGRICQGDTIEVLKTQQAENYSDNAPLINPSAPADNSSLWEAGPRQTLKCLNRTQETPDVVTFRFSHPEGLRTDYLAGQFITLFPQVNGEEVARCYTLSSSPSRAQDISITVKRVTDGQVSNWLHDNLQVGDKISADAPQGIFHVDSKPTQKLLLLSAGSGITPMLSICRYLTDTHSERDVIFYHQARTESDLIAINELDYLAHRNPRLRLINVLTQPDANWKGPQGRLSRELLIKEVPDITERLVMCCGPEGFMQQAQEACKQLGCAEQNWLQESFAAPPGIEIDSPPEAVTLTMNTEQFTGDNQESILAQAEKQGLALPFGCRAGVCGACQVKLISGEVIRRSELPLSEEDKAQGIILACSCIPQSDLKIEY